jgi:hypothetical protein
MKFFLLFFLLSPTLFAAYEEPSEAFLLDDEEEKPSDRDVLQIYKEKYQRDESMVDPISSITGVRDMRRYSGLDRNKLSLALHLNGQYESLSGLQGFEASYLRRVDNWSKLWIGGTVRASSADFSEITKNKSSGPEAAFQRPPNANQSILAVGLGVGYRLKLFLDFLPMQDVFEYVHVYGMYNTLRDEFTSNSYTGYGLTTEYSLHKRSRTSFFFGGKFTHNISWVEEERNRNFSLGWYTFALEAGFIF